MHTRSSEEVCKLLGVVQSLEVNLELSIFQREVSVEVKNKARALGVGCFQKSRKEV